MKAKTPASLSVVALCTSSLSSLCGFLGEIPEIFFFLPFLAKQKRVNQTRGLCVAVGTARPRFRWRDRRRQTPPTPPLTPGRGRFPLPRRPVWECLRELHLWGEFRDVERMGWFPLETGTPLYTPTLVIPSALLGRGRSRGRGAAGWDGPAGRHCPLNADWCAHLSFPWRVSSDLLGLAIAFTFLRVTHVDSSKGLPSIYLIICVVHAHPHRKTFSYLHLFLRSLSFFDLWANALKFILQNMEFTGSNLSFLASGLCSAEEALPSLRYYEKW